jgi:hypothetical protein
MERYDYNFIHGLNIISLNMKGDRMVYFDPLAEDIIFVPHNNENKSIKFIHGGDHEVLEALRISGEKLLEKLNIPKDPFRTVNPNDKIEVPGRGTVLVFNDYKKGDFSINEKLITLDGFKCVITGLEYGWVKGVGAIVKPFEEVQDE